jgi:hypothetical protein
MSKIHTYFGFKNGKLVSVLQSLNADVKKAVSCTYYIAEPQEVDKQIEKWKKRSPNNRRALSMNSVSVRNSENPEKE